MTRHSTNDTELFRKMTSLTLESPGGGGFHHPDGRFYFLTWKHASNTTKLLDFLNFIQPELLVPFLASFWGCGACQVRFREGLRRIYKAKSRFSQFWTFTPIISTLLEHLKISIMPPKNDWKVVYYIKTV